MNIQATLEPDTHTDDLLLRFVGGKNNGESISISTECCMLGVTRRTADRGSVKDQCAIYRGPAGVAVQSHGSEVLINGEAKSVHWLQIGDRIQLSNSQAVEVVQLGSVQKEDETPKTELPTPSPVVNQSICEDPVWESQMDPVATVVNTPVIESESVFDDTEPVAEAATETVVESVDVEGDRIDFVTNPTAERYVADSPVEVPPVESSPTEMSLIDQEVLNQLPAQNESSALPVQEELPVNETPATPVIDADQINKVVTGRFESLETSVNQLHDQAANVDRRFDRLEDSLNALTEHLERLAVSSLNRDSVAAESEKPAAVADSVQPEVTDQPFEDPAAALNHDTFAPANPSVESALESINQSVEATVETAAVAPRENYKESIASLFHDLVNTDEPAVTSTVEATLQPTSEPLQQNVTASSGNDDPMAIGSVDVPAVLQESHKSGAQQEAAEPETENAELAAALASVAALTADVTEPANESVVSSQPADAFHTDSLQDAIIAGATESESHAQSVTFTERMMESMQSDTPTLSSAELAGEVGLGIAQPVEAAQTPEVSETPEAPARAEVRTESVAEIFARLQAGTPDSEQTVEESVAAASRLPVQTTFEDIQASISATLNEEVTPLSKTEEPSDLGSVGQVAEPEPVEATATDPPADDVESVMDRLRASIDNEDVSSDETESAAEAKREDSVDDYMSMLLSRMKGDAGEPEARVSSVEADETVSTSQPQTQTVSAGPMTEEEFTPRQKAVPIKSLDKMRELANSTSRSAVQQSVRAQQEQRKRGLILQSLALGSLALAGVMIASKAYTFGAAFTMIFLVTFGYLFYELLRPAGGTKQTRSIVADTPNTQATETATDA